MGICAGYDSPGFMSAPGRLGGWGGRGRGFGRGLGRGWRGPGFGGWGLVPSPQTSVQKTEDLRVQIQVLEDTLSRIKDQIAELKAGQKE